LLFRDHCISTIINNYCNVWACYKCPQTTYCKFPAFSVSMAMVAILKISKDSLHIYSMCLTSLWSFINFCFVPTKKWPGQYFGGKRRKNNNNKKKQTKTKMSPASFGGHDYDKFTKILKINRNKFHIFLFPSLFKMIFLKSKEDTKKTQKTGHF